jgi:FKBP-type peptidyl-prolyl cis-trans isomerase 2
MASQDQARNLTNQGPSSEPLSGAQLQALQKQMADKLTGLIKDVELRKWSVDQACGLAGSAIEFGAEKSVNAVELARSIHAFLTEAAKTEEKI